jgi:hypothetical protein
MRWTPGGHAESSNWSPDLPRGALLLERLDAAVPGQHPPGPGRRRGSPGAHAGYRGTRALPFAAGHSLARDPVRCLIHTDLHYDNILASGRPGQPWVAIDPAAAVGAPERPVAELLWTRVGELPGPHAFTSLLGMLVHSGQLDPAKALAWSFAGTIDYWLWGLDIGLASGPSGAGGWRTRTAAGQINLPHKH